MKKVIRRQKSTPKATPKRTAWRILIVDDEPDIHAITRLALIGFEFDNSPLDIISAYSKAEAETILRANPDIAMAMIDIVMETDDAGLQLVDVIRNQMDNQLIRLVVRTGQPGVAPEKDIINRYDIDDYKEKNELTETKTYTTLRLALKAYQNLISLQHNRDALHKILEIAPELYHPQSITRFFDGVLGQIINLCRLGDNSSCDSIHNGFLATIDNDGGILVHAGSGFFDKSQWSDKAESVVDTCLACFKNNQAQEIISCGNPLPSNSMMILLHLDPDEKDNASGFIYLENTSNLEKPDKDLISIMAYQCAAALKNLQLYFALEDANQKTSQLLNMAEQARNMAEAANSAKTNFLAKISHELRTPLNAIIGYTALLEEEANDAGYNIVLPDLSKIQSAGQQLLGMISDILDITKIETEQLTLELSQFDLAELIKGLEVLLQPLLQKKQNKLNVTFEQPVGLICTDQAKLQQILLNLLNNANKFTKSDEIELTIGYQKNPHPLQNIKQCDAKHTNCKGCQHSNMLVFEVKDNGIGIPKEYLETIFEVFQQVDESSATTDGTTPGAGLGLSISRQLAQVMRAKLDAASKGLNQGSSFRLSLPVNIL